MQPDLELRELIATKLMGYDLRERNMRTVTWWEPGHKAWRFGLPGFELEIGPAFQAVEAMRARGYCVHIEYGPTDNSVCYVTFSKSGQRGGHVRTVPLPYAIALAIRAALESEGA